MPSKPEDPLRPLESMFEPDERQSERLEDLHVGLSSLALHDDVPLDIQQGFETAKNVRLYTYCVYRFHQVAEMVAYQSLERALRHRWNSEVSRLASIDDNDYQWPGLAHLLTHAGSRGWIRNEGFSSRAWRARNSLTGERAVAGIQAMIATGTDERLLQEPTQVEIEELTEQIDVVKLLVEHLPSFRNELGHGSARLSPTSDLVLQDVCDAINMVFDGTPSLPVAADTTQKLPRIHGRFKNYIANLEAQRVELLGMPPVTRDLLPRRMPVRGVYLFSESGRHLYVGRSNSLRERVCCHCRASSRHNVASFAYRLAIEKCAVGKATYRKGQGRAEMAGREDVAAEFIAAKARVRGMQVRFVEESDPLRQMLLEVYIALVHATPYNDFDNH